MAFVLFQPASGPNAGDPVDQVRLVSGCCQIPLSLAETVSLGEQAAILLDRDAGLLAIRRAMRGEFAYQVQRVKPQAVGVTVATALRALGVDATSVRGLRPTRVEGDKIVIDFRVKQ